MTAIIIGVWSMIFMGALMRGISDGMVRNGITTLTVHIQVHHKGYRNDPVIENSITNPDVVETAMEKVLPAGAQWTSRVRVNAVASNARHTAGITFVGIDPSHEARVSFIGKAVTKDVISKTMTNTVSWQARRWWINSRPDWVARLL
jgi:ABC-type lipoprotein release transport system permease subunit